MDRYEYNAGFGGIKGNILMRYLSMIRESTPLSASVYIETSEIFRKQ